MNAGIRAMQAYWQARRASEGGEGGQAKAKVGTQTGEAQAAAKAGGKRKAKAGASSLPARTFRVTLALVHEGVRTCWSVDATAPTLKRAIKQARAMRRATKRPGTVEAVAGVVDVALTGLPVEQA